jgi:hypothetical protein
VDVVVGAVIVTGVLALVGVVSVVVLGGPFRLRLRGPFHAGLDVEGPPLDGVRLSDVRAGRDLRAKAQRVDASRVRADRDATFEDRGEGQAAPPKG